MRYLKTTTIIGLSLLLFVACHKEDVAVEVRKDHTMMTFEPRMEVSGEAVTRGTPITDVSKIKDMGVFVYNTGSSQWVTAGATATPNIMLNQQVEQKTAEWTYAPLEPWQDQYNTLFAYAPFATASNGITVQSSYTGAPTIEYTVPSTCVDQPDLMVAVRQEDKYLGTVSFEMEHALACVGFKVNGRYEEKITKIAIKGASVSGTLSLDHSNSKGGVPQWTSIATATDTEYIPGLNKGSFDGDGTMMDVMKGDGYLMMIPQTLGPDAKLIVTVDGVDKVAKLNDVEWKAGERYTYNIEITYEPIIVGYLGGWDDVNKVYTKLLQLDWEIAKRDPALKWSNDQTATGADNPYYGITNINILKGLNLDLSNYPAAKYCEDKNKGDGWYLPSVMQMVNILYIKDSIPSKFQLHKGFYWCSEYSQNQSWYVDFTGVGKANFYTSKTNTNRVRCVRDVTP